MEELIIRSFEAIKKRGLIKETTTTYDFIKKMKEELKELEEKQEFTDLEEMHEYIEEVTDLATVCFMQILQLGSNPIREFEKVVIKNETRHD